MRLCDLCQRDEAVAGRMLCAVCAEAITRLANIVRPKAITCLANDRTTNSLKRSYRAFNLDWQNYKVLWEPRMEPGQRSAAAAPSISIVRDQFQELRNPVEPRPKGSH